MLQFEHIRLICGIWNGKEYKLIGSKWHHIIVRKRHLSKLLAKEYFFLGIPAYKSN